MNEHPTAGAAPDVPADFVAVQANALSQYVSKDRDQRCALIRTAAEVQARDILRLARKEARAKVREAVVVTRKLAAQAALQTHAKEWLDQQQLAHEQTQLLLKNMWRAITGVLESQWADPAHRKSWTQAAIHQAKTLLGGRTWRISHGPGWSENELEEMRTLARGTEGEGVARIVDLECEPQLRAGVKISTQGASLNATVSGLLTSRSEVESEFLARYSALASTPEHPVHE